ncbi:MAG TPA: hypothetical protein VF114_06075 [Candidatus Limnocylindria bacterium]
MDACAIGRTSPSGPWIGFAADASGYHLVVGDGRGERTRRADVATLLALAIAYFEEAFEEGPADREATHADLSALVRHVFEHEDRPDLRVALAEAVDAIDDGLPGDAVASRLGVAWAATANEQADPVDLLVKLSEEMLEG